MGRKDFQRWHALKSHIEENQASPFFREREIWWCALGANVGVEEDGKNEFFERPVLIYRKFNKEMFLALPLTSKKKDDLFYRSIALHQSRFTFILSQVRALSGKRLLRRLGKVSWKQFGIISDSMKTLLKETDPWRGPRVPSGNCKIIVPPP